MKDNPIDEPADTREEILAATFESLGEYGYADLTIKRIGDALGASPSLIYHYFDDKDDLVLSALEHLLESFDETIVDDANENPREELEAMIEKTLASDAEGEVRGAFRTLFELRAQAIHDPEYRAHFARSDAVFRQYIAESVEEGIASGVFRDDCHPEAVADMFLLVTSGTILRRSTGGDEEEWLSLARAELDRYLEECVFVG